VTPRNGSARAGMKTRAQLQRAGAQGAFAGEGDRIAALPKDLRAVVKIRALAMRYATADISLPLSGV
jgi:hypothetical protein